MTAEARPRRPRVVAPYLSLSSFVRQDFETLAGSYDLALVDCRSIAGAMRAAAAVAGADALFCWFASARFLPAVTAARVLGKRVVVVAGGYDVAAVAEIGYGNMLTPLGRGLGRAIFRMADVIACMSASSLADLRRNVRVGGDVARLMYLGVTDPLAGAAPPVKERVVLTVARVDDSTIHRKGLLTVARTSRLVPDVPFILAGACEPAATGVLRSAGGPNLEVRGAVSDAELAGLYGRASVYLQPSLHEGFGVSVAEAMLCGCIPIVTRRYALPEVVGTAGLYVEPEDPEGAADAVRGALEGKAVLGEDPRERILRTFPVDRRREALLGLMSEVLT